MDIFSESRYQDEFVEQEFAELVDKTDDLRAQVRYLKYLLKAAGVEMPMTKTRKVPPKVKPSAKTITRKRYDEITNMAKTLADGHFEAYYPNQHCGSACVAVDDQHVYAVIEELLEVANVQETEE